MQLYRKKHNFSIKENVANSVGIRDILERIRMRIREAKNIQILQIRIRIRNSGTYTSLFILK